MSIPNVIRSSEDQIRRIQKAISLLLADEHGTDVAAREYAKEIVRELEAIRSAAA